MNFSKDKLLDRELESTKIKVALLATGNAWIGHGGPTMRTLHRWGSCLLSRERPWDCPFRWDEKDKGYRTPHVSPSALITMVDPRTELRYSKIAGILSLGFVFEADSRSGNSRQDRDLLSEVRGESQKPPCLSWQEQLPCRPSRCASSSPRQATLVTSESLLPSSWNGSRENSPMPSSCKRSSGRTSRCVPLAASRNKLSRRRPPTSSSSFSGPGWGPLAGEVSPRGRHLLRLGHRVGGDGCGSVLPRTGHTGSAGLPQGQRCGYQRQTPRNGDAS